MNRIIKSVQIGVDNIVPFSWSHENHEVVAAIPAFVDEISGAVSPKKPVNASAAAFTVKNVKTRPLKFRPKFLTSLSSGFKCGNILAAGGDDIITVGGKAKRNFASDAATSSDNQCRFS